MHRDQLEARATLPDPDIAALAELCRLDARTNGDTATVVIEVPPNYPTHFLLRINGFYYGSATPTREDAERFLQDKRDKGLLRHALLNWAASLESGDLPYWLEPFWVEKRKEE
jgi:hypothetical protein